jgi:hypothetical protein
MLAEMDHLFLEQLKKTNRALLLVIFVLGSGTAVLADSEDILHLLSLFHRPLVACTF